MSDSLYDQRIKDLAAAAADLVRVDHSDCEHEVDNFLCGDRVLLQMTRDPDGKIAEVGGKVRGCLLVQASAALIADLAPGMTADALAQAVTQAEALMADGAAQGVWEELDIFTPVHDHKHRHDCVLLPFQALAVCLDDLGEN